MAKDKFPVGVVNCLQDNNLCLEYDITAYPRVAFLFKSYIIDFSGERKSDEMMRAAEVAFDEFKKFLKFKKLSKRYVLSLKQIQR